MKYIDYRNGHAYHYDNGYLKKVEYCNGNSIELSDDGRWYRQDGTTPKYHINDEYYYDQYGNLQEVHYRNGYIEKFY